MLSPDIQLINLGHRNGIPVAEMVVQANQHRERVDFTIEPDLFVTLGEIMNEDPFPKRPPEPCTFHFIECMESTASPVKTAKVEIRKGRSRTVRKVEVQPPLFLFLWNIFHFNSVPSVLPESKRDH